MIFKISELRLTKAFALCFFSFSVLTCGASINNNAPTERPDKPGQPRHGKHHHHSQWTEDQKNKWDKLTPEEKRAKWEAKEEQRKQHNERKKGWLERHNELNENHEGYFGDGY